MRADDQGRVPRTLDRSLVGSLTAAGVGQLSLVVSGVLVARSLGPTDRGFFALIVLVPQILSQVGTLGLPIAATYFIARERAFARPIVKLLALPAILQAFIGLAVQAIAFLLFLHPHKHPDAVAEIVGLGIFPSMLAMQYGLALLQGHQRFRSFNALRVMPSATYSLIVFPLFALGYHNIWVFTAAYVITFAFVAAATLVAGIYHSTVGGSTKPNTGPALTTDTDESALERKPKAPPSRREMASFGLRGLLGSMSPIETFRLDQAVIGIFLNPTALGLYVAGVSFTNLPRFLTQSVGMVAYPRAASATTARGAYRAVWRYFWIAVVVSFLVVVPLEMTAGTLIRFFFGADFARSAPISRILLAGTVALGARRVLADGMRGVGLPGAGTIAEIASWVALVPALLLFVGPLGIDGVALALALSWAVSAGVLILLAARASTSASMAAIGVSETR